jgi:hypothetical protein
VCFDNVAQCSQAESFLHDVAIYPYDNGVFMYARNEDSILVVSNIQAYLDLYAHGGRDLKQADHPLANAIEPAWTAA